MKVKERVTRPLSISCRLYPRLLSISDMRYRCFSLVYNITYYVVGQVWCSDVHCPQRSLHPTLDSPGDSDRV